VARQLLEKSKAMPYCGKEREDSFQMLLQVEKIEKVCIFEVLVSG